MMPSKSLIVATFTSRFILILVSPLLSYNREYKTDNKKVLQHLIIESLARFDVALVVFFVIIVWFYLIQ